MSVLDKPFRISFKERHAPQTNRFGLACCDHFGVPTPDPERAGKFYEHILGGVEVFRAGFSDEDRARGKMRHIFYHIGATLIELVEQEDGVSYPGVTNPGGANMNPHYAWETTVEGVVAFAAHLRSEGIPHSGPRRHPGVSAVSVYFRDQDGNNLEVVTWEEVADELIATLPPRRKSFVDWDTLAHDWRPH